MPVSPFRPSSRNDLFGIAAALGIVVMVVVILRSASAVLIPISLAILISFLLNPLVVFLQRLRLPRVVAVLIVVATVFGLLMFPGKHMVSELSTLAEDLPRYRDTIRARVGSIMSLGEGNVMDRLEEVANVVEEEAKAKGEAVAPSTAADSGASEASSGGTDVGAEPVPVVMKEDDSIITRTLKRAAAPLGNFLAAFGATAALTFFLLLRHPQLRSRVISLAGLQHLTMVTGIFDEAGSRVGRYLLTQALINFSYGVVLGTGLHFLGLPHALLWGMLAFFLRFIPYLGPILVATLPITLSLIVFEDWVHPLGVVAFIAGLELVTNMIVEPIFYGHSAGMSDIAILVAVMFFTWLWGPVGMIIATPLTVCLVVFSKYTPGLKWVSTLVGDEPDMDPSIVFYQRLIAHDEQDAYSILRQHLKKRSNAVKTIDEIVLPSLSLARREVAKGRLSREDAGDITDTIQRLAGKLLSTEEPDAEPDAERDKSPTRTPAQPAFLGWALDADGDDAALQLLCRSEERLSKDLKILGSHCFFSECVDLIEAHAPDAFILSACSPDAFPAVRLNTQRLHDRFPNLRILVGRWGVPEHLAKSDELTTAGATAVFTTFERTLALLQQSWRTNR